MGLASNFCKLCISRTSIARLGKLLVISTALFGHFLLLLLSGGLTEKCIEGTKEASMQIKAGARIIKRGLDIAPLHTRPTKIIS